MRGLRVYPDRMKQNIEMTRGLVFSQRVMLALVESGLSRERAYEITQRCAMRSWEESLDFRQLLRDETDVTDHLPGDELEAIFDYNYYIRFVENSYMRLKIEE